MIATLSYHHLHACRLKVYVINAKFHMELYVEFHGQLYIELHVLLYKEFQHIVRQINLDINVSLQIQNSVALQLF